MKIAIIGNPGSGKSTLAAKLHEITGIPVYHLDQYYWKPGWVRPEREEFIKIHNELCDQEAGLPTKASGAGWIIEGVATGAFAYRASKADIIIFFDIPRYICFYRVFKRAIASYGREYFSSAKGCPERMPDMALLKYMWNFNRDKKPEIEAILAQYKDEKKIFVIKNNTDLKNVIEAIGHMR